MPVKRIARPLTPKQNDIVSYIADFHKNHGYAPSLEEVAKKFGKAISTIHQHVELIKQKGYLQKESFQSRGISPLIHSESVTQVPLLGIIAAGNPLEPIENPEPIDIPSTMLHGKVSDYYALKIKGDSMVEDGIWDGDLILVKHQQTIPNIGEIIVAVTEGNVTLKKFGGKKGDEVILIPRNPSMTPFSVPADTFEVRGKFAGLIRHG